MSQTGFAIFGRTPLSPPPIFIYQTSDSCAERKKSPIKELGHAGILLHNMLEGFTLFFIYVSPPQNGISYQGNDGQNEMKALHGGTVQGVLEPKRTFGRCSSASTVTGPLRSYAGLLSVVEASPRGDKRQVYLLYVFELESTVSPDNPGITSSH